MILTITIIIIFVLLLLNIPVAFSMLGGVAYYFFMNPSLTAETTIQRTVSGISSFPLLAIIFFITAGAMMNYTGITKRLLHFAQLLTGFTIGGLAKVNILLSLLMSGMSGSNIADAAMQSKIIIPEMTKKGYPVAFSSALTAVSALITPIIPPGIALILYGFIANVSIGDMFLAGIVPGILLSLLMFIYVHFVSKKRNFETEKVATPTFKEVIKSSKEAFLAILLPVIIIGGIRLGIFSPTEAGAVAVLYALIIGFFVYKELTLKDLMKGFYESIKITASIMIIIGVGSALGWVLSIEQIPQTLTLSITNAINNPYIFLFVIMIFVLIIGMFLEGNVLLVILTPIFMPMLENYGIDPVHFGIFFILTLAVGTVTPPIGTVMFAVTSITKVKIEDFIKEVIPFWILLVIVILLIAYIPKISIWLPNLF